MIELLAPAGNMEKLETALHFGADAVYLAYKKFGLRAFADNFDEEQLAVAVKKCHSLGKKVYLTLNIFAHDKDFDGMPELIAYCDNLGIDGILVSDFGVMQMVKKYAPHTDLHLSTQANLTNKYAAQAYADMGVKRLVLARELSLSEIAKIRDAVGDKVELEAFVHGAICMAYSGRCLLSNYLTGRASNRGECAQSCRWEYELIEKKRGEAYPIEQDERGSYILNSRDLNMIRHIKDLAEVGVSSFKIEGRIKTSYYVASVLAAYRRAVDWYITHPNESLPEWIAQDLEKPSHRKYCTGFFFPESMENEYYKESKPAQAYDFMGLVVNKFDGGVVVEMRNRFQVGDKLEILSPSDCHNQILTVGKMTDEDGQPVFDALRVQQRLKVFTDLPLCVGDMLRKKNVGDC